MTDPVERRAAALLSDLLAHHQVRPAALAAELGLTFREMDRLLGGEGSLDLGKVESILTALGVQPGEFFARLYAHSGVGEEELGREAEAGDRRSGLAEAGTTGHAAPGRGPASFHGLGPGTSASPAAPASFSLPSSSSSGASTGTGGPIPPPPAVRDPPLDRLEVETVLGTVRSMVDGMIRRLDAEEAMERERGPAGPV